jgi:hypothetical protein
MRPEATLVLVTALFNAACGGPRAADTSGPAVDDSGDDVFECPDTPNVFTLEDLSGSQPFYIIDLAADPTITHLEVPAVVGEDFWRLREHMPCLEEVQSLAVSGADPEPVVLDPPLVVRGEFYLNSNDNLVSVSGIILGGAGDRPTLRAEYNDSLTSLSVAVGAESGPPSVYTQSNAVLSDFEIVDAPATFDVIEAHDSGPWVSEADWLNQVSSIEGWLGFDFINYPVSMALESAGEVAVIRSATGPGAIEFENTPTVGSLAYNSVTSTATDKKLPGFDVTERLIIKIITEDLDASDITVSPGASVTLSSIGVDMLDTVTLPPTLAELAVNSNQNVTKFPVLTSVPLEVTDWLYVWFNSEGVDGCALEEFLAQVESPNWDVDMNVECMP